MTEYEVANHSRENARWICRVALVSMRPADPVGGAASAAMSEGCSPLGNRALILGLDLMQTPPPTGLARVLGHAMTAPGNRGAPVAQR